MIKTKPKKTRPEMIQAVLLPQKAIRAIANGKVAKPEDYSLKTRKYGRAHKIGGSKVLSKDPRKKIPNKSFFQIKSPANLPLSISLDSARTMAVNAVKGILKSVSKASLASILVGGGVAAVGTIYLVAKGRINKADALRHIIKGGSGGVASGFIEIGTVVMLTALSSLPVVAQIAVLTGVSIGVKRLRNRL